MKQMRQEIYEITVASTKINIIMKRKWGPCPFMIKDQNNP